MFDNIAPTYDTLNHRLSWDIDKGWRKKAIRQLAPYQPQAILDIATGTGDFAILSAEMLKPTRLVGADISEGMMEIGRKKVTEKGLQDIISFEKEGVYVMGEGPLPSIDDIARCYRLIELTAVVFMIILVFPLSALLGIHIQVIFEDALIRLFGVF